MKKSENCVAAPNIKHAKRRHDCLEGNELDVDVEDWEEGYESMVFLRLSFKYCFPRDKLCYSYRDCHLERYRCVGCGDAHPVDEDGAGRALFRVPTSSQPRQGTSSATMK